MAKIRLQYVNTFTDNRGVRRHQFRRKGHPRVSIEGVPGSEEFMGRYHDLLAATGGTPSRQIGSSKVKVGTVDDMMVRYLKDDAFTKGLALESQNARRPVLDRFRDHTTPGGRRYGENQIATLREKSVLDFLDGKTANQQRNELKAVRGFLRFAISQRALSQDPTACIGPIRKDGPKSLGHMTWLEPQVAQYRERHGLGTIARLALELLLNIAARRHDAHVIGQQHVKAGKLVWRPHKTMRTTGKLLSIRITPSLQEAIDALPEGARADGVLTFLVTDHGKPFASAASFGNRFADWCDQAGLRPVQCEDGRVRSYRAHGLRKAALRALAHAGATGVELMAVSGHSSLKQLQEYLDEVDQERAAEAAMAKLASKPS